jgi:peptidoglycan/LPS O-acetylase OafA/YrhL
MTAPTKRNHQLDFLRGIAILLVIGRHPPISYDHAGCLSSLSWFWYNCGWMGVDLFFVLSGFLIGKGLVAEIRADGQLNVRRFLVKRAFKIWPGYFVLMLFLSTGLTLKAVEKTHLIWNWLQVQNYFGACRFHTWSLAIEEHFYLFLPIVLLVLCKQKKVEKMPVITLAIALFCLVGRCFNLKDAHAYYFSHLRMDSLFFGVFLAYLMQFRAEIIAKIVQKRALLFWGGLALIAPITFMDLEHWFVLTIGLTMVYLGFGAILLAVISTEKSDGIAGGLLFNPIARCVAVIGYFSYGIYLWHVDLGIFPASAMYSSFRDMPDESSWLCDMALYAFFCVAAGIIMSCLVELPMLKLRDKVISKFFPKVQAQSLQTVGVVSHENVTKDDKYR